MATCDPADNAAKIFRHLETNNIEATGVTVMQIFTEYYTLKRGGVNSKRKNAEFVGNVAAETFDGVSYISLTFAMDPPKRGKEWPTQWQDLADATAESISDTVASKSQ